jgi:hypothetical protein
MDHLKKQISETKKALKALETLQESENTMLVKLYDWPKIQETVLNLKFVIQAYNERNER